jgi:Zn-dependent peptidase ImmA (M78 family)
MKVRPFRIPKAIVLPGLVVAIREDDAASPILEGADGDWRYDERQAVITLDRALPIARKRYILLHELQHVLTDYMHDVLDNFSDVACP